MGRASSGCTGTLPIRHVPRDRTAGSPPGGRLSSGGTASSRREPRTGSSARGTVIRSLRPWQRSSGLPLPRRATNPDRHIRSPGRLQTESAVRNQVDHLRTAFGSDTPDFSQKLASLARKEAALAESSGRDVEVSDTSLRLTIERVLRIPQVRSDQAKVQSAPADGPPAREDSPPTGMTLSLQGLAVSFSWEPSDLLRERGPTGRPDGTGASKPESLPGMPHRTCPSMRRRPNRFQTRS